MQSEDQEIDEAMKAYETAKRTDWLKRADGSYTRLLQFAEPISETVRQHVVLAIVLGDGPTFAPISPDEHSDELSPCRKLLRLRVTPRSPFSAAPTPTLFGQVHTYSA
jgi:hypothetical protein